MPKKPRYSIEQHEKLGKELCAIYNRLNEIGKELSFAYPVPTYIGAHKAADVVMALRHKMENQLLQEQHPDQRQGLLKIYSPAIGEKET